MSLPPPFPTYIYKILPANSPLPTPLPPSLPTTPLDAASHYIHLSTAPQLVPTLARFFAAEARIYVLRVPYARVAAFVRWEGPAGEEGDGPREGLFPHLYNGLRLGVEEVDKVGVWERGEGEWKEGGEGREGL